MSAIIYQISGGDKTLILDTRQAFIYPFNSPSWEDLRFGAYVSLCSSSNNATITGLAESLPTVGQAADRFFIGLKDNNTTMPDDAGSHFMGFTNALTVEGSTASAVISSDVSNGTTNTDYWRVTGAPIQWRMYNGTTDIPAGSAASSIHFPQIPANVGGNAGLIQLRFTRAAASTTVAMMALTALQNYVYLYDSSCQIATIRNAFRTMTFTTLGNFNMGVVPDALYFYWPFWNSKLRIHALCIEKFA
jgi:hypothetical protein